MRSSVPAGEADIARVEQAVGFQLPQWLRARLLAANGSTLDDSAGVTGAVWWLLPVMDRSDRKRQSRTAEDIAWHTARARAYDASAGGQVVIGVVSPGTWLVLLPDPAQPDVLGIRAYEQKGDGAPVDLGVRLDQMEPSGHASMVHAVGRHELPAFTYHPDPVATGSVRASTNTCPSCGEQRGWEYTMTPYGLGDQPEHLCPWCIADGSAANGFGSEFADDLPLAGAGIAHGIVEEVTRRTPGFMTWQQEEWQVCCEDAAIFLGPVGWERLRDLPDAVGALLDSGCAEDVLPMISTDGDLTAYLFRCRHCDRHLAYADAS